MSFEATCLAGLIHDVEFLKKSIAYLKPDYFKTDAQKFVFKQISDFMNKYNNPPTVEALVIMSQDTNMPDSVFGEVMDILENAQTPAGNDTAWMVDHAEKWAQERALYNGIMESIAIMDGADKTRDKSAIPDILTQALAVNFDSYVGHDYFENAEEQFDYYHNETTKFPFALPMLNKITKGGIPKKTLNIYLAPIGGGKSVWLVDQAAHWLLEGKNVVFFTMEMAEEVVRERIDARIMDISFDMLMMLTKDQYLNKVNALRRATAGNLIVKEFPSGGAHVGHFRHALSEMKTKKGFKPDLIVIDYLTICASAKLLPSAKSNTNTYYTSVAEEIRAFTKEQDATCWTACQVNRDGQGKASAVGDIAAAIGIAATADFMLSGYQPDELIKLNQILLTVMKNRYNNKNKFPHFILGYDTDRQKYTEVDETQQAHVNKIEDAPVVDPTTGEVVSGSRFDFKFE